MQYNLVHLGDKANLTAFINGEMFVAAQDHPNWDAILEKVLSDDDSVVSLFNPITEVAKRFEALSDRVSVKGNRVYFDGDLVDNALTQQILDFINTDEDFTPLVNFYEKLATNPNEHSREQFYRWIQATSGLTITNSGDVIAYKGVRRLPEDHEFDFESTSSGTATVDGEVKTGRIPQRIGSVVEMPRSEVQFDPSQGCSTGLHAGTFEYAQDYGTVVLKVVINPRDVVSVPTEHSDAKVRVCRYVPIEVADEKILAPVYNSFMDSSEDDDEDNVEYCDDCGGVLDDECDGQCDGWGNGEDDFDY